MPRKAILVAALLFLLLAVVVGGPGLVGATGMEPQLCATCHAMENHYESFMQSAHAGQVTCSDCHVPHESFVDSLTAKYAAGSRHLWAVVSGNVPEEIQLTLDEEQIVTQNCIQCHILTEHVANSGTETCFHCHAGEPHGEAVAR